MSGGKLPMSNYSDTSITILCLLTLIFGGCWGVQGVQGGTRGYAYILIKLKKN